MAIDTPQIEEVYGPEYDYGDDNKKKSIRDRLERWYIWALSYLIGIIFFFGPWMFVALCLNPVSWPFVALYAFWLFYDRETPHRGGRKFAFVRKMKWWKVGRDYFPVRLVKTAELPPDKKYMIGSFPHGILCYGLGFSIATDSNNFDKAYPGLDTHFITLDKVFNFPITRDLVLSLGGCSSSERSVTHVLNGPPGTVCAIVVGGAAECMKSRPGTYEIVLKNRRGFVRIALKTGAALVPAFSFGETDSFDQPTNRFYIKLQKFTKEVFNFPLVFVKGTGFPPLLPHKRPITCVVGKPIPLPKVENPPEDLVREYHQKFISELTELFEKYKGKYDVRGEKATLVIE